MVVGGGRCYECWLVVVGGGWWWGGGRWWSVGLSGHSASVARGGGRQKRQENRERETNKWRRVGDVLLKQLMMIKSIRLGDVWGEIGDV